MASISNLGSPSMTIGGGGGSDRPGISFGVAGSSIETWNTRVDSAHAVRKSNGE